MDPRQLMHILVVQLASSWTSMVQFYRLRRSNQTVNDAFAVMVSILTAIKMKLHFHSTFTTKDLNFRFCTSALPWLQVIWASASALPLYFDSQRYEVPLQHVCSILIHKGMNFRFRITALSWLPKICVSLPRFYSTQIAKDMKFRFHSVVTAKYLKLCFRTSALPWLPKIWLFANTRSPALTTKVLKYTSALQWPPNIRSSASALPLCTDWQRLEFPLYLDS